MKLSIIGAATTQFGELWSKSLRNLAYEASFSAIHDANIDETDIDVVFVSNMAANQFEGQSHLNALVSNYFVHNPPSFRIEGACASGSLAALAAEQAILSNRYSTALVVGVEKMTDVSNTVATDILAGAADIELESLSTFPALYALLAQAHMDTFHTTREHLAASAVKNHLQAMNNPHAQFHKELSIQDVLESPVISTPLHLLDCSPLSDGAAAIVITKKHHHDTVNIVGTGHAQDTLDLGNRKSLTTLEATTMAARQAFQEAGFQQNNLQAVELHDCFTIAEILAVEDLGLCKKGDGGPFTQKALKHLQEKSSQQLELNPSGGLKACGHPVGATGVKQLAFLSQEMKKGRWNRTLSHNVGGTGATAVVHILEKRSHAQ